MDKIKQWKPGQLVTVNGVVCRVVKGLGSHYPECCAFYKNSNVCNNLCKGVPPWETTKVPLACYLKKL